MLYLHCVVKFHFHARWIFTVVISLTNETLDIYLIKLLLKSNHWQTYSVDKNNRVYKYSHKNSQGFSKLVTINKNILFAALKL